MRYFGDWNTKVYCVVYQYFTEVAVRGIQLLRCLLVAITNITELYCILFKLELYVCVITFVNASTYGTFTWIYTVKIYHVMVNAITYLEVLKDLRVCFRE